jgi:hypothetical protein
MRTIGRIFMLAALAATAATMFAGPTVAAAEETTLCTTDVGTNVCGSPTASIHETSVGKAKLLASPEVQCDVLFSSTSVGATGSPQIIEGHFTYTNCGCNVKEVAGTTAILEVLKEGHETAKVTGEAEINVNCFGIVCIYNGEGLIATVKGPLLSTEANGESVISEQVLSGGGFFCPSAGKLDIKLTPLAAVYIAKKGEKKEEPKTKTALCAADEAGTTCLEEHTPSTIDYKDSALEFLTSLLNFKCEGLVSGSVGAAGKPQEVKAEYKFSNCGSSCVVTEVSGGSKLFFLHEGTESSELALTTTEGLELFVKCGTTIKCTFGPTKLSGDGLGALKTGDNGHITFSKSSLGEHEGVTCPSEASLDALLVASTPIYVREDYAKPPTSLCSKDEGSPFCKSENQLKSIDYKDKAVELLTNLINVKCEGLATGTVGAPGNPLEVKPELTFSSCGGGCFVTVVSGPGKVLLQREGKAEEAKATAEGFEIFVKCGTTIKCLLGPEKVTGTALGALTTGDNGHLTFSKASLGKGEGATCPSEATLDATYVASSAAYIG